MRTLRVIIVRVKQIPSTSHNRDELLMYPCFSSYWGNRRYLAVQTAVVDGRGSMDVPGSRGSMVQVIAWMLGISCSGVELRASHNQMVLD